jgi:predicted dehydrogenase
MRVGIGGGGLMGREAASCFGRWFALQDFPVRAELTAVCDLRDDLLEWFGQVPTVQLRTRDHAELLASKNVDVVYVAVPYHLHEQLYCDVLAAGKDLLAEKPFGIDLPAAFAMPPKPPAASCAAVRNSPSPPARSAPSIM